MSLQSMCRSSVQMQRQTVTKDLSGGSVRAEPWTDVGGQIRCDIQPAGGIVQLRFAEMQLVVTDTLYLTSDPQPGADCRFRTSDGLRTFIFRGREPPAANYKQWPCVVHGEEIL